MKKSIRLAAFCAVVTCLGLALYAPGLSGPLLFDDKAALTVNQLVKIDGSSFDEWRVAAFSSKSGPLRRPIAMLSFAANHAVTGDFSTTGLKAVNLLIHLAIAVLLYFFFYAVLNALAVTRDPSTGRLLAITAAAIWFLHPLQVSTVLYTVQRMAQLSALFTLSGLLLFMHYRQRWAESGASIGELVAAALWLGLMTVLGMLSKENGALLPWLAIVLEVTVFRGVWAGTTNTNLQRLGWVLLVLPVIAVLLALEIHPGRLTAGYARREFTLEERLLTQPRLLWRYIGWIVWPNINDMGFQHDDIGLSRGWFEPLSTALALAAWSLGLVMAFLARKRFPLVLLALLFFLVGHSMESSVLPLEMVYEHRNYLPGMLICLAVAALLVIPASRYRQVSPWYPVLGVVAILSVLLMVRVQTWSHELTLSRVNVENHPQSSRSNYFYANALLRRYRQRERLQLSEQEVGELLLVSRHYFERMYQSNNRDVAALVMLYYLDSQFFPELQARVDWLEELENLLTNRTLQASDWNALATLMDCFASGVCAASEERVIGLLDKLALRYPRSPRILRYRYTYLSSRGADVTQLLSVLQEAQQLIPNVPWVYYALLPEYARTGDTAAMYDYARLWLQYDRKRYAVHLLKALFAAPVTTTEPQND